MDFDTWEYEWTLTPGSVIKMYSLYCLVFLCVRCFFVYCLLRAVYFYSFETCFENCYSTWYATSPKHNAERSFESP